VTGPSNDSFDVRVDGSQSGGPVVEGIPDAGADVAGHRAASSRSNQEAAPAAVAPATAYVAVDVSTTTDPHHDQGSAATGHVEDATPDTRAASTVEEERHEDTTPTPEETPGVPAEAAAPVEAAAVEPAHVDAATTATDAEHTT
jgi:hypothetical protein